MFSIPNRNKSVSLLQCLLIGSGTQPTLIQWILQKIQQGVGGETDSSPSPSAYVKNGWSYTSILP